MFDLKSKNILATRALELKILGAINAYEKELSLSVMGIYLLKDNPEDSTSLTTGVSVLSGVPMYTSEF